MSQKRADCFRANLLSVNQAGRTFTGKEFVWILIIFSAGKGNNLSYNIRAKFCLACGILNYNIFSSLIFFKCNKLKRNYICSLMKKLVKRMLAICARLSENYRTCYIIYFFTKTIHAFSIRLHVELLKMGRES